MRGEEEKALLGWWIAAEMGHEAGQNNVAFALERGVGKDAAWVQDAVKAGGVEHWHGAKEVSVAEGTGKQVGQVGLEMWTRSAAQDNVDAMVKVGDYYCEYYLTRAPRPGTRDLST